MSLHLLPAISLGARLDEIERTARELFGSAVTISAETESPYTRSDEAPKPDKAIKVVIKIELPGAFPKLVSEQACPGGRASPAMEIGEPSSRASSSEGACAASSALDPTPFPATTTSSGAPSVSTWTEEQRKAAESIGERGSKLWAIDDPEVFKAVAWERELVALCAEIASVAHLFCTVPHDPDFEVKDDAPTVIELKAVRSENRELHAARLEADNRVRELQAKLKDREEELANAVKTAETFTCLYCKEKLWSHDPETLRAMIVAHIHACTKDKAELDRLHAKNVELADKLGTQRAPVKLPRLVGHSGRWALVTEKGSGTYVNLLDAFRQALSDAGVQYEDSPASPLGRPEDQA